MAQLCLFGQHTTIHADALALVGHYTRNDPATTQPWADLLTHNTPGASPLGVPLFVAQGATDTLVLPNATQQFVAHSCATNCWVAFGSTRVSVAPCATNSGTPSGDAPGVLWVSRSAHGCVVAGSLRV